ncbi:hypothetical protein jhhlp_004047 [Lomentospora prolificans]|uniref:MFS maltose permease n=1 Tax=Lomentospora prolificans TaxID=41688 RepID=A0A2N3NAM8_9PEZI|nr:hypothetical protein jhhlp_004047 [Lomentospora prolificans]
MRERTVRRLLTRQALRYARTNRIFSHNITYTSSARPQLAFLSIPSKKPTARFLTTETKQRIKHEAKMVARYMIGLWGTITCLAVLHWTINQELLERKYPTPHELSWITRILMRGAFQAPNRPETVRVDWVEVIETSLDALRRLEDPKIDGKGIKELVEGSIYVEGVGKLGYDVTDKSEHWRRGYYETLMLAARAAEQLDGWVVDKTRGAVFPPDVVLGPSNPNPKPISVGSKSAPREEDCEMAYEPAENYYLRILTTKGFTSKQKLDAALAYASFLDFKKLTDAAESMYRWALSLAVEDRLPATDSYDPNSLTLSEKAGPPSSNLLTAMTAFATHKASVGEISTALPMFISVLKARRSLANMPPAPKVSREPSKSLLNSILSFFQPPPYPDAPDDGTLPPWRNAQELCEEAALNLYIGEILFATKDKEEGIAWTREAVDAAEEQLREVTEDKRTAVDTAAKKTCQQCLSTGLYNWSTMAATLAHIESERKKGAAESSTFSFWSRSKPDAAAPGRWAAEEEVARERIRRTRTLLEEVAPPPSNPLMAVFKV